MMRQAAMAGMALIAGVSTAPGAELMRGRCHMDQCTWYSIEERDITGTAASGALIRATVKFWTSHHPGGSYERRSRRIGGDAVTVHALCAKDGPWIIYGEDYSETGWNAYPLDPASASGTAGASEQATATYFAICHGIDVLANNGRILESARRYGYREAQGRSQRSLSSPMDILQDAPAGPQRGNP